jgi:aspartate aminotransferase
MGVALVDRLRAARAVLAGVDSGGARTHPGMSDPGVISLAHGDGTRRPHASVVATGLAALLETEAASLEDYLFLQHHEEFEAAVTADFIAHGLPDTVAVNLAVDSGTTRLFAAFLHACTRPGDVMLVPRSYYHPLPGWCELHRVGLELVETGPADDYKLTPAAIDAWCAQHPAHRPRGVFLFNPTQTGALYRTDELAALADVVRQRNLFVLEDSVFAGTEFPGCPAVRHLAAVAPEIADRTVTVRGASKAFNLANIRIGWACGPAGVIARMSDYTVATSATVPYLSKTMALAALRAPADYLATNAAECAGRAQLITELVAECNDAVAGGPAPLVVAHQPRAGHAILVAAPGLVGRRLPDGSVIDNSIDVTRYLLADAHVATSPGYSLGFDATEMRLAFGSVGVRHTYAGDADRELALGLRCLAVLCERRSRHAARRAHEASAALVSSAAEPAVDVHLGGRELIIEAFRDRITPSIQRALRPRAARIFAHAGGPRGPQH